MAKDVHVPTQVAGPYERAPGDRLQGVQTVPLTLPLS